MLYISLEKRVSKKLYILIGEYEGDYEDFYERPTEVIGYSESEEKLEEYSDRLFAEGTEFINTRVEVAEEIE